MVSKLENSARLFIIDEAIYSNYDDMCYVITIFHFKAYFHLKVENLQQCS